jgi:hypothetical protein
VINLDAILLEPEPISVYVPTSQETEPGSGRLHNVDVLTPLPGRYEVHDQIGAVTLTADGVTRNANPRLFGAVDTRIQEGRTIKVDGDGRHAGKQYRIGAIANWGSHIESDLEDV